MKLLKRLASALLALALVLGTVITVSATEDPNTYIRQMINYYKYYQDEAQLDYACLHESLSKIDAAQAEAWDLIIDEWARLDNEMDIVYDVLPDGLPEDDSLCIVVLGYALKSNGGMRNELIGRLKAALASAEKYPNAYIACTGGGTAGNNKNATEAGQMAQWLIEQGVDESRIIVEDNSLSTVQNAQYTYQILSEEYPSVKNLAVVTSDYHISRGCVLFQTQSILGACTAGGRYMNVVANAAYKTYNDPATDYSLLAGEVARLAGVSIEKMGRPILSQLAYISVSCNAVCEVGMELDMSVTAHYTSGLSRNVTRDSKFSGFDFGREGIQTVTITYTEGDAIATATFDINMVAPDGNHITPEEIIAIEATVEGGIPTVPELPTEEDASDVTSALSLPGLLILAGALVLALIAIILRKRSPANSSNEEQE